MYADTAYSKTAMVPPDDLEAESSWDSSLFLRSQVRFLLTAGHHRPLRSHVDSIFEGQRVLASSMGADAGLAYQISSIAPFELSPTLAQWVAPAFNDHTFIRAGDVVLKRLEP